jgi:transposase InsO family protein
MSSASVRHRRCFSSPWSTKSFGRSSGGGKRWILAAGQEVSERRNQLRHPAYARPELLATGPNELWSWDITKLKGPAKWTWFYLYVLLDVFSRYVPGWMVASAERRSSPSA